jgi:hypothetical protein
MTLDECRGTLLDFFYDRRSFKQGESLEGMAVSEKSSLFIDYYRQLSEADRAVMNQFLISSFLGKDQQTRRFIGLIAVLLTALVKRVNSTGLEVFQAELLGILRDPERKQAWLSQTTPGADFERDWRYPLAIINILDALQSPSVKGIAKEMASAARSEQFRKRLSEIANERTIDLT